MAHNSGFLKYFEDRWLGEAWDPERSLILDWLVTTIELGRINDKGSLSEVAL